MLDSHGFDLWADTYDETVKQAEESNQYPFAGYTQVINAIYGTVMQAAPARVLDIGFGTAMLTGKLYEAGFTITGLDFSDAMLAAARVKMPKATLLQWDFTKGLPPVLRKETYDCIISTYALHHLSKEGQRKLIQELLYRLNPQGKLLVGDVCFSTQEALEACRRDSGSDWDDEENYFVFSEWKQPPEGFSISFHPFSFCGGVVEVQKQC